jgi:hypothetical protein
VSNVKAAGEITVKAAKNGYSISPDSQSVKVLYMPAVVAANNPSIKAKFGITATGTDGVKAAFNTLHDFIQGGGLAAQSGVIKTGDWIDLEGGLTVEAYDGTDNKGGGGFSHDATKAVEKVYNKGAAWGTLCRLIVVGVNSFNGKNGNNTPHVVFQFQNTPGTRRMNASRTIAGGYASSEMRTYLTGNFLTGLNNAGVPDGVLWAPARVLSKGNTGTGATEISDKLWLPTEWEMIGERWYSADGETADNQAWLAYYTDSNIRKKAWCGDTGDYPNMTYGWWYWMGSLRSGNTTSFCAGNGSGDSSGYDPSSAGGVAPAFCVN